MRWVQTRETRRIECKASGEEVIMKRGDMKEIMR